LLPLKVNAPAPALVTWPVKVTSPLTVKEEPFAPVPRDRPCLIGRSGQRRGDRHCSRIGVHGDPVLLDDGATASDPPLPGLTVTEVIPAGEAMKVRLAIVKGASRVVVKAVPAAFAALKTTLSLAPGTVEESPDPSDVVDQL
jgi:hypothetical protein